MDTYHRDYVQVSRSKVDDYGRLTDSWDALEHHMGTTYSPTTGTPLTISTKNALDQVITNTIAPAWGSVAKAVDANNKVSEAGFDPLGRITEAWGPGRTKGVNAPNSKFTYELRNNGAVAIGTSKLKVDGASYVTSYALS